MEKRKQIVKKSVLIIVFLLLLSIIFSNHSYAEFEIEDIENSHYTKEYQEYLKLSDEEKAKLNVIPPKYAQTLREYIDNNSNPFETVKGASDSSYDLREHIDIRVENQGSEGLCWAFAGIKCVETNVALNNKNLIMDLSEMHVNYLTSINFWSKYTSNLDEYNGRQLGDGGNFDIFTRLYTSRNLGPVNESDVPYVRVPETEYDRLKSYTPVVYVDETVEIPSISSYSKAYEYYTEDELNMHRNMVKQHLIQNGSIYIDIYSDSVYSNENGNFINDNYLHSNMDFQDHAISLIGWNDNYSKYNFPDDIRPENDGAYIAQNSWGDTQTIIYISYEDYYIDDFMYGVKSCSLIPPEYETIKFNDVNFYNYFRKQNLGNVVLRYDDNNLTITLSKTYIESIRQMKLSSVGDLTGIEYFSNLSTLNISNSILTNMKPLQSLPNLNELDIFFSAIEDNNASLESLRINKLHLYNAKMNNYTSFINKMINVQEVNIYFEESERDVTIDFSNLSNLKRLGWYYLDYDENSNSHKKMTISAISNSVEYLDLSGVKNDVSLFNNLDKLKELNISNIDIDNLDFLSSNLVSLEEIYLFNTRITNIDGLEILINNQTINGPDYQLYFSIYDYDNNFYDPIDITKVFNNTALMNMIRLETNRELFYEYLVEDTLYAAEDYKLEIINQPILNKLINTFGLKLTLSATNEIDTEKCKAIYYQGDQTNIESIKLFTNDTVGANEAIMKFKHKSAEDDSKYCSLTIKFKYNMLDPQNYLKHNVKYITHIQNIGWEDSNGDLWKKDGQMSGTSGRSLRLEGIKLKLSSDIDGGIEYVTHIQNNGWEDANGTEWKKNGEMSGTLGQSLRLEAIKIRLTGNAAEQYDVYYQVHAQNIGWMDWAKNGEAAGTAGFGFRLEGIQIVLVPKGSEAPGLTVEPYREYGKSPRVVYSTHVQNVGDQPFVANGAIAGTSGQSLRLESIRINLENLPGGIEYVTHVQILGWEDKNGEEWKKNGERSGTAGKSYRLEAIKIRLTGPVSEKYDIYYRVHAQNIGWMGWAKNGEECGTAGHSFRLEGIQIVLVKKGQNPPAYNPPANKAIRFYN